MGEHLLKLQPKHHVEQHVCQAHAEKRDGQQLGLHHGDHALRETCDGQDGQIRRAVAEVLPKPQRIHQHHRAEDAVDQQACGGKLDARDRVLEREAVGHAVRQPHGRKPQRQAPRQAQKLRACRGIGHRLDVRVGVRKIGRAQNRQRACGREQHDQPRGQFERQRQHQARDGERQDQPAADLHRCLRTVARELQRPSHHEARRAQARHQRRAIDQDLRRRRIRHKRRSGHACRAGGGQHAHEHHARAPSVRQLPIRRHAHDDPCDIADERRQLPLRGHAGGGSEDRIQLGGEARQVHPAHIQAERKRAHERRAAEHPAFAREPQIAARERLHGRAFAGARRPFVHGIGRSALVGAAAT